MLARPKLTKPPRDDKEKSTPKASQARSTEERFHLRVDGQSKRSFALLEDAIAAGREIKKSYPVVVVNILDTEDGSSHAVQAG